MTLMEGPQNIVELVKRSKGQSSHSSLVGKTYGSKIGVFLPEVIRISKVGPLKKKTPLFVSDLLGNDTPSREFFLPLENATYEVESRAEGLYLLECNIKRNSPVKKNRNFRALAPYFTSLGLHLILFAVAFAGQYIKSHNTSVAEAPKQIESKISSSENAVVRVTLASQRRAFQGMSLWNFSERNDPARAQKRLSALLEKELTAGVDAKSTQSKGIHGGAGGSSLNADLQAFRVNSSGLDINQLNINEDDRNKGRLGNPEQQAERLRAQALLKTKIDGLQSRFRTFFDKILESDANFNVHLVMLAEVGAGGALKNISFQSSGHSPNQQPQVARLTALMRRELERLEVPQGLNGFSIKREFVFWR